MQSKNLIYTISLISIFYLTGYSFATEVKKEEVKKIYETIILGDYEELIPGTVTAEPGTTVIWVNYAEMQVKILFLDKNITTAADSPSSFFVGKNGAYESVEMCRNCTASLCFRKKGKFDYIVKSSGTFYFGKKEFRGTILIK